MDISDYLFVDTVLVDFTLDKTGEDLDIIVEAYYPQLEMQGQRKFGRINISASKISVLEMKTTIEFSGDVKKIYSPDGKDNKMNEVYAVITQPKNNKVQLKLDSDYLQLTAIVDKVTITELD